MTVHLVVNADDLGASDEVNAGVVEAHDRGIVTSASVMVRGPAVGSAVALARARPSLGLGLHLDLGEWIHVDGAGWVARYLVVDTADADAVSAEIELQLGSFGALFGRPPTHLDSHQHVHCNEPVRSLLLAAGARLGVPVRRLDHRVTYCGDFYGQGPRSEPHHTGITTDQLVRIIRALPHGWTELGCHPGIGVDPANTAYALEREMELRALCSADARAAILANDVVLTTFAEPS